MSSVSLNSIPQEVLSEIALFAATDELLGLPSGILPILSTNRWTQSCLSFSSNPYVYAKIYEFKFDARPALRRLGRDSCSTISLANELKRKCLMLKRIRRRRDSVLDPDHPDRLEALPELILQIYVTVLENEGNNVRQLRYAGIDEWLAEYLFDERGASGAYKAISSGVWPAHSESTCMAIWLFWFTFKLDQYKRNEFATRRTLEVLKAYALGAHWYPLVTPAWQEFLPSPNKHTVGMPLTLYETQRDFKAPALSAPAVLSFLSLVNHLQERTECTVPVVPSLAPPLPSETERETFDTIGNQWEREWGRSTNLAHPADSANAGGLSASFRPGCLNGVWEGIFTFTEFTSYAALLSDAPPHFLKNVQVAQHKQTWKLREHHLLASSSSDPNPDPEPVSSGHALHAYYPLGTSLEESPVGVKVKEPGRKAVFYRRASVIEEEFEGSGKDKDVGEDGSAVPGENSDDHPILADEDEEGRRKKPKVLDIIITGEGHSSWGEFTLVGRIRPYDGFLSLSKNYIDGDRGKWLYRGYVIGNINPNIAGRWRDTMTPQTVPGYEGCFTMTTRS